MWSHRLLAEHLADDGISASQIGRILADLDLKPHRVRGWLTRRADPNFFAKAAEVCDLYLHPPAGSVVVCVDEKTAIGARSRKHPDQRVRARPRGPPRVRVHPPRHRLDHRRPGRAHRAGPHRTDRQATTRPPSSGS